MKPVKLYDTRKWKELGFKEKSQYVIAYSFGFASIILGFVSFIWLTFIPTSVIALSGLWASVTCAILGISLYIKSEILEMNTKVKDKLNEVDEFMETEKKRKKE